VRGKELEGRVEVCKRERMSMRGKGENKWNSSGKGAGVWGTEVGGKFGRGGRREGFGGGGVWGTLVGGVGRII